MKKVVCILLTIVIFTVFCSCKKENAETDFSFNEGKTFEENFIDYIEACTDENYVVSPVSLKIALGMLLAGADGNTKDELISALGVEDEEKFFKECREIQSAKNLTFANSIWKNENIEEEFKEDFKKEISENFEASYESFNAGNAVEKINGWVSDKTDGKITDLLKEDFDGENTVAVILNALRLEDVWKSVFKESASKEGDFKTASGKKTKKIFMNQIGYFRYFEDEDTEILIMTTETGINMAFVLGNTENLSEKISKAEYCSVEIFIPKFETETSLEKQEIVKFLKEAGVKDAFCDNADFSEMFEGARNNIYVDDIIQKARIKIDENGLEAQAATAIEMRKYSMEPGEAEKTFRADKPFSFYMYFNVAGETEVLFAGKVKE